MTSVTEQDKKLWADYGTKLMDYVMQGGQLSENDRFYLAPLSAAGIAAGKNISEEIKNQGVYLTGDTLLELDTPVFMPTRKSYVDRARLYANSVELFSNNNPGAIVRYNNAQDQAREAQDTYNEEYRKARTAWLEDKSSGAIDSDMTLGEYCAKFYPRVAVLSRAAAGAAGAASQAAADVSGPDAAQVSDYINNLALATDRGETAGYTMKCSPASANQIGSKQTGNIGGSYNSPRYDITASYSAQVDGWIATYAQKHRDNQLIKISFSAKSAEKSNFTQLGFDETKVSVDGSYAIFFSATYKYENKTYTKDISASEAASELEVTVTATDIGTYVITPGQRWNPASLFGMPLVEKADPSLRKDVAYVNQVVMAYGVGISLKMSSKLHTEVHSLLEKAKSSKGSARFFGFNIGLGGSVDVENSSTISFDDVKSDSSGGTIDLPSQDNAYPTLLAVLGTKLTSPPPPKN